MTIQEAHYHFKLYFDRIDSSSKPDYNPAEIDYFLNEAQLLYLKQRYNPRSNRLQEGFEMIQKRTDELSSLVVKFPVQQALVPTKISTDVYELDLSLLAYPYLHYISATAEVQAPTCKYDSIIRIFTHDTYEEARRDPFVSNKDGVIGVFGRSSSLNSTSLFLYSPLPILLVKPEYIKIPRRVSLGTYVYLDGIQYPPTTFEFPEATHQEIVDLACKIASLAQENPNDIQIKELKNNTH